MIILNVLLSGHDDWLQNVVLDHLKTRDVLSVFVNIVNIEPKVRFLVIYCLRYFFWSLTRIDFDFLIEHLLSLFHCLLSLNIIELLKSFFSELDFGSLVCLNFDQDILILALGMEVETPDNQSEQVDIQNLVALTTSER